MGGSGTNTVALAMYLAFYFFLVLLFVLWVYSIICRCHLRYSGDRNTMLGPTIILFSTDRELSRGLEESMIETFPKFPFMDDTDVNMGMEMKTKMKMTGECAVCLGMFQENEMLRLLPKCGHVFHVDCVDIWLRSHDTCPFCRANLLVNGEPVHELPTRQEV